MLEAVNTSSENLAIDASEAEEKMDIGMHSDESLPVRTASVVSGIFSDTDTVTSSSDSKLVIVTSESDTSVLQSTNENEMQIDVKPTTSDGTLEAAQTASDGNVVAADETAASAVEGFFIKIEPIDEGESKPSAATETPTVVQSESAEEAVISRENTDTIVKVEGTELAPAPVQEALPQADP